MKKVLLFKKQIYYFKTLFGMETANTLFSFGDKRITQNFVGVYLRNYFDKIVTNFGELSGVRKVVKETIDANQEFVKNNSEDILLKITRKGIFAQYGEKVNQGKYIVTTVYDFDTLKGKTERLDTETGEIDELDSNHLAEYYLEGVYFTMLECKAKLDEVKITKKSEKKEKKDSQT